MTRDRDSGLHGVLDYVSRTPFQTVRAWTVLAAGLGAIGLSACAPDTAVAPAGDPHLLFASLTIHGPRTLNLSTVAPDDTVRLQVTAQLADGSPVPAPVIFTADDTTITVDSAGMIRARHATASAVRVRVTLDYRGVLREDSVMVRVTDTLETVTQLTIRPNPDSQARASVYAYDTLTGTPGRGQQPLVITATSAAGDSFPGVLFSVTSSDTGIATVDTLGLVRTVRPGHVTVYATAFVHGVTLRDSLPFVVTWPEFAGFDLGSVGVGDHVRFSWMLKDTVRIMPGGIVNWSNGTGIPIDVVFDDPTTVAPASYDPGVELASTGGGNIQAWNLDPALPIPKDAFERYVFLQSHQGRARRFPVAGRYPFHSTLKDVRGVVMVCDDAGVICGR